jgi:hypothetical protein
MSKLCRFGLALVGGVAVALLAGTGAGPASAHDQHGPGKGHLHGSGAWGTIELVGVARVTTTPDLVADVAVSPNGQWAFLANWGEPDCAGPETGGQTSPDAGAWVIDISDLSKPTKVGFIPSSQDTRPGEGMQVVPISTRFFTGDVLVMNNEQCGKNGKGGISLYDVTDPRKPVKLSEHFGDRGAVRDANDIHSSFAWDTGEHAYAVIVDNFETTDVDILDITNPSRPRLIRELSLAASYPGITQAPLGLTQVFLHDMTVKRIGTRWVMLLSYWDGGFVQLDVTDPVNPTLLGDTDYAYPDPHLQERTRSSLAPEGNGHQAEFTADDRFFIATDEDFAPFGATRFEIATGPHAGPYPSVPVPGAAYISGLADQVLNGPTVYGGYGCPGSAPLPRPEQVPGYLAQVDPGEEKIIVLQRGPSGDPSAPEAPCQPGVKAHNAVLAGWDAVLFVQLHGGTEDPPYCGAWAFTDAVVGVCTSHEAYHKLFNTPVRLTGYPDGPALGTIGGHIRATARFDGWGYVHLFGNAAAGGKFPELDTYAIPEAHDPAFATGYGDLTVHEVATDPQAAHRAYLSYYSGGLRALEIRCAGPRCELVEVGGYLDPKGNNFWGVEAFVRQGQTYLLASDLDSGLWIFRSTSSAR